MARPEFAECMGLLESLAGEKPIPPNGAAAWFLMLGHLGVEQLQRAIVAVMRQHRFAGLPAIGQIAEAAEGPQQSAALPNDQRAVLAWDRVLDAISRVGGNASARFVDPLATASIRSLGVWLALCDTPSEELRTWKCKEFIEAYKSHAALCVSSEQAVPLPAWSRLKSRAPDSAHRLPSRLSPISQFIRKPFGSPQVPPQQSRTNDGFNQSDTTDEPLTVANVLLMIPGAGSRSPRMRSAHAPRRTNSERLGRRDADPSINKPRTQPRGASIDFSRLTTGGRVERT